MNFGRILCEVQRLGEHSILVSWLGGEPLAWGELADLSRRFHQEFGLRLGVTTNGLPLALPSVRASLLNDYEQITISIDGLADFHDEVRGQAGLFGRLREHVAQLRSEDPQGRLWRRVNIVLMRGNIHAFASFAQEMADWGFHELTFNQLGGNERPEFYSKHHLLPDQVQQFVAELPELKKRMAQQGLQISGSGRYLNRLLATSAGQRIAIDDCQPGTEFLFIDALGRISPCSFSSDTYGVPLSEVRSVKHFLRLSDRFREIRQRHRLAVCEDCHATHVFDKFKRPAILRQ